MSFSSINLMLTVLTHLDLELFQMDIKETFMYGELDKGIYMEQCTCFKVKRNEQIVWHLKHSLYGLKELCKNRIEASSSHSFC